MSEEILKALTQLFAIITKQDGGVTEKERQFVIGFFQQELDQDSVKEYLALYDKYVGYKKDGEKTEGSEDKNEIWRVELNWKNEKKIKNEKVDAKVCDK